jgi:uncharacterized RDD family membrane protein YckC
MEHVGVGLRAVAAIIDLILLLVLCYIIAMVSGGTTEDGFQLEGLPAFLAFVVAMAYYVVLEGQFGWTVGKRLIGLKVVRLDGAPLDWQASLIRNLLRIVDGLFFYLVGAIIVWTSAQKQRLGDKLAGTVVVRSGGASS